MENECIIFDLDGTLVDSLPGIAKALNATLEAEGFPRHPELAVRGFVGDGLETTVRRACPAGMGDDTRVARLVEVFRGFYQDCWRWGTRIYPGVAELLTELDARGAPLAVLSNKSHAFTDEMVREFFPGISFAAVLGLRPGMPPKPDPSGAFEIAHAIGIEPGKCRFIGDSTIDIETARNAGMRACAVTWGYHDTPRLVAAVPDGIAGDVEELRRWVDLTDFAGSDLLFGC